MISFGSDNHSGVHPQILAALNTANHGFAEGYGEDELTEKVTQQLRELFGGGCDVWLMMTGTGANITALQSIVASFQSIICADYAHINVDECGAVQKFTQARLEVVKTIDGKLTPNLIEPLMTGRGDEHRSQKRVISISQSTEYGTVYNLSELTQLADYAHQYEMLLHVDGARLANAAAYLNVTLEQMTKDAGIDLVSFGGTKNGMMFGEAVISFRPELTKDFIYYRKQAAQLFSKMRYISAQYAGYINNRLWLNNARAANKMARYLADKLLETESGKIVGEVQSNAVFAVIPLPAICELQKKYHFYVWDESKMVVRLMCSFDTTKQYVDEFIADLVRLSS